MESLKKSDYQIDQKNHHGTRKKIARIFKLLILLKYDSIMSPVKEENIIIKKNRKIGKLISFLNKIINEIENNKENIIPPTRPSKVFFGLIVFNIFVDPYLVPITYENISKVIIIKIIKLKLYILSLLNPIFKKKIKEINKYIKINILFFLKNKFISTKMIKYRKIIK